MGLSVFLKKIFAPPKSRLNQAGQAVLEYILVLVVIVSIILGILYQFNDAFKNFLDSYFGDYIACLLETGELPSLGGDGPGQAECIPPFQDFNIASGQSLQTGGGGGASVADESGPQEEMSSGPEGNQAGSALRPSRVTAGGAPINAERTTGGGSLRPGSTQYRGGQQGVGVDVGFPGENRDVMAPGLGGSRTILRRRYVDLSEEYLSDDEKKKKERESTKSTQVKKTSDARSLRKARFALEVPEPRQPASSVDGEGMDFGRLVKLLVIAAIIIAILLFVVGQAVQIKKSWQKSD